MKTRIQIPDLRLTTKFARSFVTLSILVAGIAPVPLFAQSDDNIAQIKETDHSIIDAMAPYNDDTREAILTASQYPGVLTRLAEIHDRTSQQFQRLVQSYSQKKQNWFYEISRYPKIMHTLATSPKGLSQEQVRGIVANSSEDLTEAAWKLYQHHHNELVTIDQLNESARSSFEQMIGSLDRSAQDAFYKLVDMPDVLSLLNDHIDLTVRLADSFKKDPEGVRQELADAHDHLETLNKTELEQYRQDMVQNPQAMDELQIASQEYAKETGYSYPAPAADTVINYNNYAPYSYWFGYPGWYGSPMWYPGSVWSNTGIYFGMGYPPYIYGLPSLGFSNWFFGGAYRRYPHLYRQYDRYYHNSIVQHRTLSVNNSGFMGVARQHFNPGMTGRSNWYSNPAGRSSAGVQARTATPQIRSTQPGQNWNRSNASMYHGQSWGGVSRGSFGGGFRGSYGGGGMRGGRH